MTRFNTLLDAAAYLTRYGYHWHSAADEQPFDGSQMWSRQGWKAYVHFQKNGRVKVETL